MLAKEQIWEALVAGKLVQYDIHVVLGSGLHTQAYFNAAPALMPYNIMNEIIEHMFASITQQGLTKYKVSELAIMSIGCGLGYGYLLGQRMGGVPVVHAEKSMTQLLTIKRGQEAALKGRHVILVDDVYTTGATLRNTLDLTTMSGGIPASAMAILNRHKLHIRELKSGNITIPFTALFHKPMETFSSREACPACKQNLPFLTQHGGGDAEFHLHGQPDQR